MIFSIRSLNFFSLIIRASMTRQLQLTVELLPTPKSIATSGNVRSQHRLTRYIDVMRYYGLTRDAILVGQRGQENEARKVALTTRSGPACTARRSYLAWSRATAIPGRLSRSTKVRYPSIGTCRSAA
jgi:hypothetical protein